MNTQDSTNDRLDALQAELDALNAKIRRIDFTPSGYIRMNLTAAQADRRAELNLRSLQVTNEINQIIFEHRAEI